MQLSQFIVDNTETLVSEWEDFARTILPAAGVEQLRDGARDLLLSIAVQMETAETAGEQRAKSRGNASGCRQIASGRYHGAVRFAQGFDLEQVVFEYRALRASVVRLWAERQAPAQPGLDELTRFNQALDENLADALSRFSADVTHSRDLVMAVLGHDLRSPLGAIANSAHYLLCLQDADPGGHKKAASLIASSAARMAKMVSDLLDFARTRLGDVLPISPEPMHFIDACRRSIDEQSAFHPDATFRVEATGDLTGTWDPSRISQLLSNLVGNAIQHGAAGTPISIVATAEPDAVVLSVHNAGVPIAPSDLHHIFDPLAKAPTERPDPTSLGLGLYIAREVARAHGGTIAVASSKDEGTTFTVRLPRTQQTVAPPAPMLPTTQVSTIVSPNEADPRPRASCSRAAANTRHPGSFSPRQQISMTGATCGKPDDRALVR